MSGDDHVVELMIGKNFAVRRHQLRAHHDRQRAAEDSGKNRETQIERADVLVIGRGKPAREEARNMTVLGMDLTFTGDLAYELPDKFKMRIDTEVGGQKLAIVQIVNGAKVMNTLNGMALIVRTASDPNLSIHSIGSTPLPLDFDIFFPNWSRTSPDSAIVWNGATSSMA